MSNYPRDLPAEDSWRVVEGENDSFDTSILPSAASDDDPYFGAGYYPSSGQPSSALPSQLSSLGGAQGSAGSQDSIGDFARHREDENVILREPFRPTMPPLSGLGNGVVRHRHRTLQEELSMAEETEDWNGHGRERKTAGPKGWPWNNGNTGEPYPSTYRLHTERPNTERQQPSSSVWSMPVHVLTWIFGRLSGGASILWTLSVAITIVLAISYLIVAAIILFHNFTNYPLSLSVLPLCHVPLINTFTSCTTLLGSSEGKGLPCIDFSHFANVHNALGDATRQQADLIPLSMITEQSEPAFAHLRSLLEADDVTHKSLVLRTFDEYNATAADIMFAADEFHASMDITVNRTIKMAESAAEHMQAIILATDKPSSKHSHLITWLFSPFQVPEESITEYFIRQRYSEHGAYLSKAIFSLHGQMANIIDLLKLARDQVRIIVRLAPEPPDEVPASQGTLGFNLWTLLAVRSVQLSQVHRSLASLNKVLEHHSDLSMQLRLFADDLDAIKTDIEAKLKPVKPGSVRAMSSKRGCVSKEDQIDYLKETTTQLRYAFDAYMASRDYIRNPQRT